FGLPLLGYGLIYNLWICVFGAICIVGGIYGWVMEPSTEPDPGHEADHGPGAGPDGQRTTGVEPAADQEAALVD
ncbi:MAG: hypothetical protein M3Z46_03395, partial [Actinomycetota bacterium]|nr:hypothetical protein [Actinomycetota bacterium]